MNIKTKINRLEEIKLKIESILKEKKELIVEHKKILSATRKFRIKKLKDGFEIICTGYKCGNIYTTTKNPNAELKDDRPQCRNCGIRVETKN